MNSGEHPDTARFLEQLVRFRRRLALVAFTSHLPIAVVATVATGAAALAAFPIGGPRPIWFGVGAAVTLALAWLIALVRTPSVMRTAAILDRRFALDDRTVTALEFARNSDSLSRLIIIDASAHLAAHTPRELPLEFPRRLGWLSIGVVAVFTAVGVGRSPLSPDTRTSLRDRGAKTGNGVSGLTKPAPSPAPTDAVTKADGAAASQGSAHEPAARAGQRESSLMPQSRANPTLDSSASQATSSPDQRAADSAAAAARGGDPANTQGSSGARTSGGAQRSGAGETRNGRGAGPGGGAVAGLEAGTGGVNGAVRSTVLPPPPTRQPDADSSYAGRFRRAWDHAESPVAQERIPAGLRAYVRDYFLAIRPDGQQ